MSLNPRPRPHQQHCPKGQKFFCFFFSKKRRTSLTFLLLSCPLIAQAQSIGDLLPIAVPGFSTAAGVTAATRLHQDSIPRGITLGITPDDLLVYPSLTTTAGFDSAPGAAAQASANIRLQPTVRISDAALGLAAFAGADINRYPGDQAAAANNITAGIGLDVPFGAGSITLGGARITTQESALGTSQAGASAPFAIVLTDGRAALRLPLGAFDTTSRIEFSDTTINRTTSTLPAPFRARALLRASGELATANDGVLRLLARLNLDVARYSGALAGAGVSNATTIALLGGAETAPGRVLRLRMVAGIAEQHFAGPTTAPRTIPVASIGLGWTPDPLIAAELDLSRESGIDTTLGTQGEPVTTLHFALANAFTRTTLLTAAIDASAGTIAGHQARETSLQLGAAWSWPRHFSLQPSLSYAIRHNLPGSAPHEMRVMLALTWAP
ncbi:MULTISPECIES: outer membrane beta-barrel protein [Acidiphilium]|uniref:Uncharacterized protein n=1 Tax=Acidiphilium rubrum TaxID=526 RepID=A0A8G2CL57_ACIRU|nr:MULTISPECIES: outer membrane beta-barrel protein [Acidiphilium]SIQ64338.1 hypothetical protein SAMN05421828_10791 [Acidiphilium rubrum]